MMDRSEIFDKVATLIAETLEVDADELTETTSFNDLGADSFDMLELVTAMEDEFEVTVDEDGLGEIETIGDAMDVILKAQ
ncbi:acyl carrier protein [Atopobium sp. oral taxon 810]|uniref:acyl carrier protein n=1 Tax=Atopobium sp. oral taxon 810 TaxID=712158 RepID=UPI0003968B3C|nr:putative acyl carrier protein [Atopobium sp. oral taxon 810 str. F0209]